MSVIDNIERHATKYIGYIAAVAGAITLMDKELVIRTLGPNAPDWALLITGGLAIFRGHQRTAKEKRLARAVSDINQQTGVN